MSYSVDFVPFKYQTQSQLSHNYLQRTKPREIHISKILVSNWEYCIGFQKQISPYPKAMYPQVRIYPLKWSDHRKNPNCSNIVIRVVFRYPSRPTYSTQKLHMVPCYIPFISTSIKFYYWHGFCSALNKTSHCEQLFGKRWWPWKGPLGFSNDSVCRSRLSLLWYV